MISQAFITKTAARNLNFARPRRVLFLFLLSTFYFLLSTPYFRSPLTPTTTSRTGMLFPDFCIASCTTRVRPEQHGTSIRATVTDRTLLFAKIIASFSTYRLHIVQLRAGDRQRLAFQHLRVELGIGERHTIRRDQHILIRP